MPTIQNMDCAAVLARIQRFREEFVKSQSSPLAHYLGADLVRARTYLDNLLALMSHYEADPQLDLPEWAPHDIEVADPIPLDKPENEMVVDMARLVDALHFEVMHSQSAGMATSVISHDLKRWRDVISKMHSYLDYAESVSPVDLPESSPTRMSTGPGRTGTPGSV